MSVVLRRTLAVVLVLAAALWLLVDKAVAEGPVLLVLGGGHGLTASDLLALPPVAVAALLWRRPRAAAC